MHGGRGGLADPGGRTHLLSPGHPPPQALAHAAVLAAHQPGESTRAHTARMHVCTLCHMLKACLTHHSAYREENSQRPAGIVTSLLVTAGGGITSFADKLRPLLLETCNNTHCFFFFSPPNMIICYRGQIQFDLFILH